MLFALIFVLVALSEYTDDDRIYPIPCGSFSRFERGPM